MPIAIQIDVTHIAGDGVPQLPRRRWSAIGVSIACHAIAAAIVATLAVRTAGMPASQPGIPARSSPTSVTNIVPFLVFVPRESGLPARGGGGGGNRQPGPIRHAEGIGSDRITLRVAKPVSTTGIDDPREASSGLPQIALDAKPLASGTFDQVGLPVGGVSFGTSTGPGSGGGVGEGVGTGIGPGRGPGVGPGSGGGMGGGVYRPGGRVSSPRLIREVRPKYTAQALLDKIQGAVVLELIVQADGTPSNIRVVRSLDRGLDQEAIQAASEWRFEPGRLAGQPVDVVVTLLMDFRIH